jgi:CRP-like cAMP-binding protein
MIRQDYAQLSLFTDLDIKQIRQLSPFLIERQYPKDYVIFEQGQPAENLYILQAGEVVVRYKPYDGPPLDVSRIIPGRVFGWSSALRRDIYTSDAIALQDCAAFCIRGSNLQVICANYPETGKALLERLASDIAEELRSTHTQVLEMLMQGMKRDGMNPKRSSRNDGK